MAGRNTQVSRILTLLDILDGASRALTVAELHSALENRGHQVERRTVYRDLEALSQAGFPLQPEGEGETNQQWKLERSARINDYFVLTARELFALYLSKGVLAPLQSTPFYDDVSKVFKKLESHLGLKANAYLEELEQELKFEPGPQWGLGLNPEVLETVRAACAEGHILEVLYYSANTKTERTRRLGAHYLYYAKGGLYLVAEDLGDQKVKMFAIPRMKTAIMTEEAYQGEVKTPEVLFQGSMGVYSGERIEEVVVEFEAEVAPYVRERRWHPSQRVTALEGGRIRVNLELSQTPELYYWILGFAAYARVISPASVADKVATMAKETAERYQKRA